MSQPTEFNNTPFFVLKDGTQPISLAVNAADLEQDCVCIYGFSGNSSYAPFIQQAAQLLTPYPLVPRYLADQIEAAGLPEDQTTHRLLIILDAANLKQEIVSATSMVDVLHAHQAKLPHVPITHRLRFDPKLSSYRLEKTVDSSKAI